jgi:hypothetical protein
MISLYVLTQQSLFSLLHQIDLDLARQTKERRCPIVGDRCTMPTTGVNRVAALQILKHSLSFVTAFAAGAKDAAGASCLHRSGFGTAGCIGLL